MLTIQPTESFTGVKISGDYWDIDALLTAIYTVCGEEQRYFDFQGPRNRIAATCIKLRNAIRAEHHVEFVSNGIHKGIKQSKKLLAPEKNVYFAVELLMPELLFTTLALNDFIDLYQEMVDPSQWNVHVATIRQFQGTVNELLKEHFAEEHFGVFTQMYHTKQPLFFRYATQYVDVLNLEYIALPYEARIEGFAAFALRLMMEDDGYMALHAQLMAIASETKLPLHELDLEFKYPEHIIW